MKSVWRFVSDSSIVLQFQGPLSTETSQTVLHAFRLLQHASIWSQTLNLHPAYTSLLIDFDPTGKDPRRFLADIQSQFVALESRQSHTEEPNTASEIPRVVRIPVRYGGECGPDLAAIAKYSRKSEDDIIDLHSRPTYTVGFLGFAPGFAYLLGLPELIHYPRKETPRLRIPAGSVALAGAQTGIYPTESPAGWQWIGSTDQIMFDPRREPPSLLNPGDSVRFMPVKVLESKTNRSENENFCPSHPLLVIESPGSFTTIQDRGRFGYAHLGVSAGGAADPVALDIGNKLVGNLATAAALEMTAVGVTIAFLQDTWIAITGGVVKVELDSQVLSLWTSVPVAKGQRLVIGPLKKGLRAYLCVHGGIDAELILGSRSTFQAGGWGGQYGRPLQAKDAIHRALDFATHPKFRRLARACAEFSDVEIHRLRMTWGPQADWFSENSRQQFLETEFTVTTDANRLGLRLHGTAPLPDSGTAGEMISEGVANGSVQITSAGQAIILFCEQQTTGGYPKIATVIRADWHRLGQLKSGDRFKFELCGLDDAWIVHQKMSEQLKFAVEEF